MHREDVSLLKQPHWIDALQDYLGLGLTCWIDDWGGANPRNFYSASCLSLALALKESILSICRYIPSSSAAVPVPAKWSSLFGGHSALSVWTNWAIWFPSALLMLAGGPSCIALLTTPTSSRVWRTLGDAPLILTSVLGGDWLQVSAFFL